MMNLDDSLRDKAVACGDIETSAQISQGIKFMMRRAKNWDNLNSHAKEALELISTNIASVLVGDPNNANHWNAIATMARMMGKPLEDAAVKSIGIGAVRKGIFAVDHLNNQVTDDGPDAA
jgi:hypothetical protein